MQVLLRQIIEFFTGLDPTQIITTIMIVGGSAAVTLFIYFDSTKPRCRVLKVEEADRRLIRINDINRSIRRCSVSIHGTKLVWDQVNRTERYFAPGEGGNAIIPRDMVVADHSTVIIRNGRQKVDKMRYGDIPPAV